jgi:hypothetical protein
MQFLLIMLCKNEFHHSVMCKISVKLLCRVFQEESVIILRIFLRVIYIYITKHTYIQS